MFSVPERNRPENLEYELGKVNSPRNTFFSLASPPQEYLPKVSQVLIGRAIKITVAGTDKILVCSNSLHCLTCVLLHYTCSERFNSAVHSCVALKSPLKRSF